MTSESVLGPWDIAKAFNEDFTTANTTATAFMTAMNYSYDVQNTVALDVDDAGMDPAEAAQKWVDANPDVWQPWVDAAQTS